MDEKIIEIAKLYDQKVINYIPAKMFVLYGSHAKGNATEMSDINLAIVVDKIPGDYLSISANLFNLVRNVNKLIEPVLLCSANDKSGFLESILKHGKIIYQSEN